MSKPKAEQADRLGWYSYIAKTHPGEWVVLLDVNVGSCHSAVARWKEAHPEYAVESVARNTYKARETKTSKGDVYYRFTLK